MAVSAYASLISLEQVLSRAQQLQADGRIVLGTEHIPNFRLKIESLISFLQETRPEKNIREIADLIREASRICLEAEVIIDELVVDQLKGLRSSDFAGALEDVIRKIESVEEGIRGYKFAQDAAHATDSSPLEVSGTLATDSSSNPPRTVKGLQEKVEWAIDKLVNDKRILQVIAISGMGGVGKSTLAQAVYNHQTSQARFAKRIWCTVSQNSSLFDVFQVLLGEKQAEGSSIHELGLKLYNKLLGHRYLIVLDDVWDLTAWNRMKSYLPEDENSSGVIITTQISNIADSVRTTIDACSLDLLDENTSWELLKEKIFGYESCPRELEETGKRIARSCRGLPLSVVIIAGVLSQSRSVVHWEDVATNVSERLSDDEHGSKVLQLSYQYLPMHLKPCFLYLRNFKEDERIEAKYLIRAWISEGLVRPVADKKIEDVSEEYLRDLIDRNMVLILKRSLSEEIKECGVHDLLRELCIKESQKENFVSTPRILINRGVSSHLCLICSDLVASSEDSGAESYCSKCKEEHPFLKRLKTVRFFDAICHTTLRYIDLSSGNLNDFPLHYIWNLQFLILKPDVKIDSAYLDAIWGMPQIRYVELYGNGIHFPNSGASILSELQTLLLRELRLSNELVGRIPNLLRLALKPKEEDHVEDYSLHLLESFCYLRLLTLQGHGNRLSKWKVTFPVCLEKLSLKGFQIHWDETMTTIGSLPNLRVLQLEDVRDPSSDEWVMREEEAFPSVTVLILQNVNLRKWESEDDRWLPVLERLVIEGAAEDFEIPLEIGDVPTLRSIRLNRCGEKTIESAKRILEEQVELGNECFEVYVDGDLVQVQDEW